MIRFAALFAALALAGCSTTTYRHGATTVSRTSVGVNLDLGIVDIRERDGQGVRIEAVKSDQVEAVRAVAEGVARGLADGVKP